MEAEITGVLAGCTINNFTDPNGVDRQWCKTTLIGKDGEPFIFSLDVPTGEELIKNEKSYKGKTLKVNGVLRYFKGVMKFKGLSAEVI